MPAYQFQSYWYYVQVLKIWPPVGHRVGHRVGHGLRLGHGLPHVLSTPDQAWTNFTEDAHGLVVVTHGLAVVALLNNFCKKSRLSVTCKLATLIWSFSRSSTRQQIRVRLVSLAHQSYMACIRPSYCYARQKFGLSISAGSFIALISQSNAVGSRKKWTSLMFPTRSWRHVFNFYLFPVFLNFSFLSRQFSWVIRAVLYFRGCNFFKSQNKQHDISFIYGRC